MKPFVFDPTLPVLPMDNPAELESLTKLINEHIEIEARFSALLCKHDDDTVAFKNAGGDALSQKGNDGYFEIASHPATSINTILLKARYLAARKASGDLSFEQAVEFVASFIDLAPAMAPAEDPLLVAITAYRKAVVALNDLEIGEDVSLAEENALIDAVYGKEKDLLIEAAPTVTSVAGVREAIRLAFDEDAIHDMVAEGALRAALAYLDGRASA
ncbi:hypothetical protein [Shinella zoogloeoides]|uniref:hypothetical protein n=1 Tax=Shinella zoogloeoides TaxID=352475 RepID=UPI00273FAEB5|nr:hypothetical protein [Shinella zoogloeoides]WLR94858.1 hypothetical protein Q9316_08625 [Shinella zoogloeoides]